MTLTRTEAALALAGMPRDQLDLLADLTPAEVEFVLECVLLMGATLVVPEPSRVRSRPYDPRTAKVPF